MKLAIHFRNMLDGHFANTKRNGYQGQGITFIRLINPIIKE